MRTNSEYEAETVERVIMKLRRIRATCAIPREMIQSASIEEVSTWAADKLMLQLRAFLCGTEVKDLSDVLVKRVDREAREVRRTIESRRMYPATFCGWARKRFWMFLMKVVA